MPMTTFNIQTRTFEKKKGMSTEICADGDVSDDTRLSIKVIVEGVLPPERDAAFRALIVRQFLRLIGDKEFKDVSKS
ncbi:hypothetical protein AYJ09_01530 [Candidatus Liberibacter solanacearum]|nr:hypothetical protein AYJ09_01530 [Candidatus Liberibacter solanacearum]